MTERAAEAVFAAIRWAETEGRPVCPRCGCPTLLRLPPSERRPALALQSMPGRFFADLRHLVRIPQAADPHLSRSDRHFPQ
jgi:hypothetical protein